MNKLTLARMVSRDDKLHFMACVDGAPVVNAFTTNPWDILHMATLRGKSSDRWVYPHLVAFSTCSCDIPECNGYEEFEATEENNFVTIKRDGAEPYIFDQVQILEELHRVISEANLSNLWKTVWWDVGDWADDDIDMVAESKKSVRDLLDCIVVQLQT